MIWAVLDGKTEARFLSAILGGVEGADLGILLSIKRNEHSLPSPQTMQAHRLLSGSFSATMCKERTCSR